jgi:HEPN domain-containing protein
MKELNLANAFQLGCGCQSAATEFEPARVFWVDNSEEEIHPSLRASLVIHYTRVLDLCKLLELPVSEAGCLEVLRLLESQATSKGRWLHVPTREIGKRIVAEMQSRKCFYIGTSNARFFDVESLLGEEVKQHFPGAWDDLEEAGKCFALGRSTACVFHLMRSMEVAIKAIWKTLNLTPPKLPDNWGALIGPMDKELSFAKDTRNPLWVKEESFFAEAVADVRSVKKAWRDTTIHLEKNYTNEQAEKIFNAVVGLMRDLATRLNQNGEMH